MVKIGNPGCFEHKACISLESVEPMSPLDRYVHQGIRVPHLKLLSVWQTIRLYREEHLQTLFEQ